MLDYEIDSWDDVGETATIWVRVPLIDGGSTTDYIHMYYNNTGASDGQSPGAVRPAGIGVYHMDDDPGLSVTGDVKDSDATPNDGTLPTWVSSSDLVAGQIGKAVYLDGGGDYIDFASVNVTNTFTISAWIKPHSSAGNGIHTIAANSGQGNSTNGWRFFVNSSGTSDGRIFFETGNGSNGNSASTASGVINFDQWNHVSVVVNRTTGAATIYHDGVNVTVDSTIRTDFNTTSDWEIGRMEGSLEFTGDIDEARIDTSLRTADEVRAAYLSQSGAYAFSRFGGESATITVTDVDEAPVAADDPGDFNTTINSHAPLSYWRFGESAGGTAADGGSVSNAAVFNGVTLGQAGVVNGDPDTAVQFDGTDDFVEIAHDNAYLIDDGTVQLWFNADDLLTDQGLLSKDSSGLDTGGHFTIRVLTSGSIEVRLQSTSGDNFLYSAPGSVTAGNWHHVAVTFGSTGMALFLDGARVDTDPYTGGWGTTSGGIGNYEPIAIGASTQTSGDGTVAPLTEYFGGRIDEVAIVGQALTPAQIRDLYASTLQHYTLAEDSSIVVTASARRVD